MLPNGTICEILSILLDHQGYIGEEAGRFTPTLPAFVPDVDSPAPSPPAFPIDFGYDSADSLSPLEGQLGIQLPYGVPGGWAEAATFTSKYPVGGHGNVSTPFVVTPQSPVDYPYDHVMKDAFEAAFFAEHEGRNMGLGYTEANDYWINNADVPSNCLTAFQQHAWF